MPQTGSMNNRDRVRRTVRIATVAERYREGDGSTAVRPAGVSIEHRRRVGQSLWVPFPAEDLPKGGGGRSVRIEHDFGVILAGECLHRLVTLRRARSVE
jgi:hypothetical protein